MKIHKGTTRKIGRLLPAVLCLLSWTTAGAFAADGFYKGKQITMLVSGEVGGTIDGYARFVAKHMPKHIPGQPSMVVKSMTGASGLKATNYIYNAAPGDGTEIAAVHGHIPTSPILKPQGVQYDPNKIGWIGSVTKETFVAFAWHTAPIRTLQDAMQRESIFGGQAVGSMSVDMPILANEMVGTKFKIITGYKGAPATKLAVERGEMHGNFGTSWTSLITGEPEWITQKRAIVFAQFGLKKHQDLPAVPLLLDYAKTPEDKQALELYLAVQETGKPFIAPPGVPKDRLAILQAAFEATMKDPGFLKDTAEAKYEVFEPMSGEEIRAFVDRMSKTPPSIVTRLNAAFDNFNKRP